MAARLKYPFLAAAGLSTAAALLLLLFGGRGERHVLPKAPFAGERVAVVELTGVMTSSQDAGSRATSAHRVIELLEKHRADGTVKAVDARSGSVSVAHGPVASLNWPSMTMDFKAANDALLAGLKPGAAIIFGSRP